MANEETIFAEALGKHSAGERSAYLDKACASDPALRRAVDALLVAHDRGGGGILEAPPVGVEVAPEFRPPAEAVGATVGPYKLLEQIGGGGMGVVYMAEQLRPVRRKVALKIIKPGMDSGQVIARFEAERQALTMMEHPNIAKVLDAGTTDAGRPYFVMELVKGVPITDYCDQARLTPRERLELFIPVCHAVQHAHQKGVIHRDLKPGNVLVTLHDDNPVPKVIDFGIAKAAGQQLTERTLFTNYAQMLGTPLYMSPEQAQISGQDVDTRSDVYSLGVLLYELLTGTTPFDKKRLRDAAYDEMRRIIREEDPPKPSTRLDTMGVQLTTISQHRHTDPKKLGQLVRGELDWIVMKALEKDRARRYESANGLGRDIERHLANEAVHACPPSTVYRFRKFARRNKAALTTAAIVCIALILGMVIAIWQATRAKLAEQAAAGEAQRAKTEAAISLAVVEFLNRDLLAQAGQGIPFARYQESASELKLRTVLDRAAARIDGRFPDQPVVEAAVRQTVGIAYRRLDLREAAKAQFRRAVELRRAHLGAEHTDTLTSLTYLAYITDDVALTRDVYETRRRVFGEDHPDTIFAKFDLAIVTRDKGDWIRSLALLREVLEAERRVFGPEDPRTGWTMHCIAHTVVMNSSTTRGAETPDAEIEAMFRQALASQRKAYGERWYTFAVTQGLGEFLLSRKRYADAEAVLKDSIARLDALPGAPPELSLGLSGLLDSVYRAWGDPDRLAAWERQRPIGNETALSRNTRLLREQLDDPALLTSYGSLLFQLQRYGEAEAAFRTAVTLNPNEPGLHQAVGDACASQGRLKEAEAAFREAIRLEPNEGGRHHNLAEVLRRQRRYADAEAEFTEAIRIRPSVFASHYGLGSVCAFRGQWEKATKAFEQAAALSDPNDPWPLYRRALLCAYADDLPAYQRACRTMLERYEKTTDARTADGVAKTCALLADSGIEGNHLARLADVGLAGTEGSPARGLFETTKAIVDCRAGYFDSAARRIALLEPGADGGRDQAAQLAILAMAKHGLGKPQEAKETLASAQHILAAKMPKPEQGDLFEDDDWHFWIYAVVLCREAERSLSKPPPG